jgi:enoyl-CoA hydratase
MIYKTILLEKKDGYAIVRLNRPEEMNAISSEMHYELFEAFTDLENDSEIKAIIITGGEFVFSAGMDIKELTVLPNAEVDAYFESARKFLEKIYLCKKPLIAAVGGFALTSGFNLAVVCDLIIASESAIFCHPELKIGLNPIFHPLSQIVGILKAREIAMLCEPIGAQEALKIGLVNKITPPEKLLEEAEKIAAILTKRSAKALEELKKIYGILPGLDKTAALKLEYTISASLFTRDERKLYMSEVLFLDKLCKVTQ